MGETKDLRAASSDPAPQNERKAFEAWWKGDLTDWRGHNTVESLCAWDAWQARAAFASDEVILDAARYQVLRNWRGMEHDPMRVIDTNTDEVLWGAELDAALDAAMQTSANWEAP